MTQASISAGRSERTVVARAWAGPALIMVLLLILFVGLALPSSDPVIQWAGVAALAVAALVGFRGSRIGLYLTDDSVEVVNLLSTHSFDRDTVRIDLENESSQWPADDIPSSTHDGAVTGGVVHQTAPNISALYLSDESGRRARVGVAPSYGGRSTRIAHDLSEALAAA